ncbi:HAD-IIIC family phosphatase [Gluconobacter albidus]|uniref:HAD-IIIC family phosphatase n=1 Tax=Gluconobacter albidus TaxID=318683 RepID=UPI001B8D93BB|nr:HAD-IIIC family phosphatase [Gluconobacter albidus]MBS1028335.1 HAD family hydrolase [Gluconobacter albidus]
MSAPQLAWLPDPSLITTAHLWDQRLSQAKDAAPDWDTLLELARYNLNFIRTMKLDRVLTRQFPEPPTHLAVKPVRLALLGSSTISHLIPSLRVAALRHGIWLTVHTGEYGSYRQELGQDDKALKEFAPTLILLLLDARHIAGFLPSNADQATADMACQEVVDSLLPECWRDAKSRYGCPVLQTSFLPVFPRLMGSAESLLPSSSANFITRINSLLPDSCRRHGAILVDLAAEATRYGLEAWYDPSLWWRAKQEIAPSAAPVFGELVGRSLAALAGRSSKCLVLDLDNTLWGGVIGDDGLDGIELGQGSPLGEAFVALQDYALRLSRRGVVLAVCSKNDELNARLPFQKHPEMILKEKDIGCFVANWNDKAENIREIASRLSIGLDSIVFVDDNPFERARVREALPMVNVPEIPEDPTLVPDAVAAAGYFDLIELSSEDLNRSDQYQANLQRQFLQESATDFNSYLSGLNMTLVYGPFDSPNLSRITQLINKSNQFNLTTRRYSQDDLTTLMVDDTAFGLWFRLTDRFGDNGLIAVVIGRDADEGIVEIDTWLMSCRVLGRGVEEATLSVIAAQARARGAVALRGIYLPTSKNNMVADMYSRLGFALLEDSGIRGKVYILSLVGRSVKQTSITLSSES